MIYSGQGLMSLGGKYKQLKQGQESPSVTVGGLDPDP